MAENSKIEWTDHTFNPWWGCVRVSPGCQHCYAETFAKRVGQKVWGVDADRRFFGDKHWNEPLKWNRDAEKAGKRARVFCASMADVFEDRRDLDEHRHRLWNLIELTPWLEWLLLTKRPENFSKLAPGPWVTRRCPDNVRVGTTAEDQQRADERLAHLVTIPAHRFVSVEPQIGPVTFRWASWDRHTPDPSRRNQLPPVERDGTIIAGSVDHLDGLRMLDWIIVGGESGPGARPFNVEWAREIVRQCVEAGVPVLVKQLGADPKTALGGRFEFRDRKGGDWSEWPEDLRIRQFPHDVATSHAISNA